MRGYVSRFNRRVCDTVDERLPEYAERDGERILVKSTLGLDHLRRLSNSKVGEFLSLSKGASNKSTSFLIPALITSLLTLAVGTIGAVALKLLASDLPPSPPADTPEWSMTAVDYLLVVPQAILAVLVVLAVWYLIFLVLTPIIAVHEFGHLNACERSGLGVEAWGILFFGPIPMGAAIVPERMTDWPLLPLEERVWILSSGPFNDLLHGAFAILVAYAAPHPMAWYYPAFVLGMGLYNLIPFDTADGGRIVTAFILEWMNLYKAIDEVELGMQS